MPIQAADPMLAKPATSPTTKPTDPSRRVLAGVYALGATVETNYKAHTASFNVSGVQLASKTTHLTTRSWRSDRFKGIKASFGRENMVNRLTKLVRKELQAGDSEFDDLVYIQSATPDATLALLQDPVVRGSLYNIVSEGGDVSIWQGEVRLRTRCSFDHEHPDERDEAALLLALMRRSAAD
ncbi:MAG: hypothetical protein AB8H79_03625 [Myxococcota bacterium]